MGISSKLLLDASGAPVSEVDSIYSLNDRGRKSIHTIKKVCEGYCRYSNALVNICICSATNMPKLNEKSIP